MSTVGKSKGNKKAKTEPTKHDMHAVVVDILKEVDFNTVSNTSTKRSNFGSFRAVSYIEILFF